VTYRKDNRIISYSTYFLKFAIQRNNASMKQIMTKIFFRIILLLLATNVIYAQDKIVWNEISQDESASFPFGNGTVGGNVWAEKDGMYLYLARNDCFSELGRLLKAGKLKLTIDGCRWDENCIQVLDLHNGIIEISNSTLTINVFADSEFPVIWIRGNLKSPSKVSIEPRIWRTESRTLEENEKHSSFNVHKYNGIFPIFESADISFCHDKYIGFYHHNDTSTYDFTLKNNHLDFIGVKDPFKNRTFGTIINSDKLFLSDKGTLSSIKPISEFTIKIAVTSFPDCTTEQWKSNTLSVLQSCGKYSKAVTRTKAYWNELWSRSYLEISTPDIETGRMITELYNCQRWLTLSAGRSEYPIKFNGSIFTVSPEKINSRTGSNPDYRQWGECFWWQNTRLPYFTMLKTGDWESIRNLGYFYNSLMPAFREQAKVYYGIKGAIIPEVITQFGTFTASSYSIGTKTIGPKTMYTKHIFQDPLELIHILMDYYRYSDDEKYLQEVTIPMSEEFLDFFISYAKIDSTGKMRMRNTQSIETYWYGVENDMPTLAGLHAVMKDFSSLSSEVKIPQSMKKKIDYIRCNLPDIPYEIDSLGEKVFAPAEKYKNETNNFENPELMTVFPFDLCNFTTENLEVGRRTFKNRKFNLHNGWSQDVQISAMLGLTEETKNEILIRLTNQNKEFKFPAYFGPNFNWVPDGDHGATLETAIQDMVIQSYDGKVYLLPAFPKDWNVKFRFAVPGKAYVWGEYHDGKWIEKPKSDKVSTTIIGFGL